MDIIIDVETLPEAYAFRLPDNRVMQEKTPVYALLSAGFYGIGASATLFEEGEIVVAPDTVPNMNMQPLNRAAGLAFNAWIESLPIEGGVMVSMEELTEAATMLEGDADVKKLPASKIPGFIYKFASRLKQKREGTRMHQPSVDPHFGKLGTKTAPPLLGAEVKDPLNNFMRDRKPMPGALQRAGTAA